MVVNPQIELQIVFVGEDFKGSCLLAAFVPPCRLPGVHRRKQPFAQRGAFAGQPGLRRCLEHLRACQHVPGHAHVLARDVATPVNALRAGMGRGRPIDGQDMNLAMFATRVAGDDRVDRLRGRVRRGHTVD